MRCSTKRLITAIFFSPLVASLLQAQGTATILGTITDSSGASVAGAQVTVINVETQLTRTVSTNDSGEYVASAIPTGAYSVIVQKPGFEKLERSGLELTTASRLQVDLQLPSAAKPRLSRSRRHASSSISKCGSVLPGR